ncbi:PREDICTED: short-chain dehydrogenase/reductase family 16C member 6-like isoform X2 [Dinoponera quadriceps]|uniref:Short-chain dehydrogenase/reductase family 16C member 6-like isoform X2 n=1 Tax=Dinoponera quadriceps TaxID=609295 RepID=A0A6P3X415_DINQU|nr:PREDICTED: short-chain dehydrogenase/reductase family 16C member 6-like isoform X2 [Dinoponera quadriceps]
MNKIKEMGKSLVHAYRCDVSDKNEVFKVAAKVKKEVGDVSILINNAGIAPLRTLLNYDINEISRVVDVNLMAHYWTMKTFLPNMIERNHGHIVAISSVGALYGIPHGTIYSATKIAIRALMESVSEELRMYSKGKSSVKFTTIVPGIVTTGLAKNARPRFPWLVGTYSAQHIASLIIDAQRRDFKEKSFPSYSLLIFAILRFCQALQNSH